MCGGFGERERDIGEGLRHGIVLCVSYVGNSNINGLTYNIYMPQISMKNPGGSTRVGKGAGWGPTTFRDCRVFFFGFTAGIS